MKAVLGWLSDPYIHVLAVGLILVRFALAGGADDATAATDAPLHKLGCARLHTERQPCAARTVDTR